jgi:hypothetical protein
MIEDGEYLFEQLQAYLPASFDRETAMSLHRSLAAPDLMRMAAELGSAPAPAATDDRPHSAPSFETLDRAALLRELKAAKRQRLPLHKRFFQSSKRRS